jgi:dihydroflavonol-4-reductase
MPYVLPMRILVTGGTGFVGSYTVAELVRAGHDVRLLVRSPERIAPALQPFGIDTIDYVQGDMCDAQSVEAALDGQEAVIHAAATFSLDRRDAGLMRKQNVMGAQTVLEAAVKRRIDPILYVSSVAALMTTDGRTIRPDAPPGVSGGAYAASKVDGERAARALQEQGAPIKISYPGLCIGSDPHHGEASRVIASALRGQFAVALEGGVHWVDVRDVARVHAAILTMRPPGGRYIVPGEFVTVQEAVRIINDVTGRNLKVRLAPRPLVLSMGRVADAAQRVLPLRLPFGYESLWSVAHGTPADDTATREELGIMPAPLSEAIADTIRGLLASGRIKPHQAGKLAATAAASP